MVRNWAGSDLLTYGVRSHGKHRIRYCLEALEALGVRDYNCRTEMWIADEDKAVVDRILRDNGIEDRGLIVGINPNVSAPLKGWPLERFARLADRIVSDCGAVVVLTGGKGDIIRTFIVARLMENRSLNLAGRLTLGQLAALIDRCDLFISCDSGPAHIAMAVNTPLVVLFGPTEPEVWGPLGDVPATVIRKQSLSCGPCYSGGCEIGTRCCMESITVEEVFEAATRYILVLDNCKNELLCCPRRQWFRFSPCKSAPKAIEFRRED